MEVFPYLASVVNAAIMDRGGYERGVYKKL
jgi:hypothetical protein